MKSVYTPGPWFTEASAGGYISIYAEENHVRNTLARVLFPGFPGTSEEQDANARVMAASPKLLEALIELNAERCVCGHAKSEPGESHFFGDPPRNQPMHTRCMVGACTCAGYAPDFRAELIAKNAARAAIRSAVVS